MASSGEDRGGPPLRSGPAGRRMSPEDLEPAPREAVPVVSFDDLEPGSPAAHEAVELGELGAPAERATILSIEDLRIRRDRRKGAPGRRGPGSGATGPAPAEGDAAAGTRARRRGVSRGSEAAEAGPAQDERTPEEQEAAAKEICLRLLTDRARSKHELATALRKKGVAGEISEKVLERFDEVGLIDDQAFADAWVRSRHRARGLGRRAIAQELRRKGVAKEVADTALTEVDDAAEEQRARELVDRRLRGVTVSGPEDRQKAGRRLLGMLARKGYPPPIAYRVVRTALAEHGADEDELGPADLD
ncbi:hypothetical protein GCM10023215_53990 [Pseudonocardia yuanmonensis]|uniref:Regulatory protein RecX n=1 Tax=Pseudonocardia yuanmonensis TaxID=1095914 RepID=A0ABP8XFN2_9PSEU